MGLFGMIGSAIGAVGSFISGAVSTVGSVCSSIGGTFMSGVKSVATGLLDLIAVDKNPGVFDMIQMVAGALGIDGGRPEELGMKMQQCEEKPKDFESIEAYIEHVNQNIELSREKWANISNAERLAYGVIGSATMVKAMEQKIGVEMPVEFLKVAGETVNDKKLSGEGMKNTLYAMKERGLDNARSYSNYMEGNASPEEHMIVYDSLKEALHKEFPDLSDAELNKKVTHIKDFVQQDK